MIYNFGMLCLFVTGISRFLIGFVCLVIGAPLSMAWDKLQAWRAGW